MANPLRGEIDLKVGDDTYKLALDVNAFCAIENMLKMRPLEIVKEFSEAPDGLVIPRALLWGALQKHHEMTLWDAGNLLSEIGMIEARAALSEAMAAMFGMEKQSEGRKRANPPRTRTTG